MKNHKDPAGLLKDADFMEIMNRSISAKAYGRMGLPEIIKSRFLKNNEDHIDPEFYFQKNK